MHQRPTLELWLVTSPDTTNQFSLGFLKENLDFFKQAEIIYFASFFLTAPEGLACMQFIIDHCSAKIALNLSAPFIIEKFRSKILDLVSKVDYVFGNESEAIALADTNGPFEEVAKKLQKLGSKFIITRGAKSTVEIGQEVTYYEVPHVEKVVDTTGAGDAFVGGYFTGLAWGKSTKVCIDLGSSIYQR